MSELSATIAIIAPTVQYWTRTCRIRDRANEPEHLHDCIKFAIHVASHRGTMRDHVWEAPTRGRSLARSYAGLLCLIRDARTVKGDPTYREWCARVGADPENPASAKNHSKARSVARRLKRVLGDDNYDAVMNARE